MELPAKVALKVKKTLLKAVEESEKYEDKRQELLETYGEKDADGKLITNSAGQVQLRDAKAFAEELQQFSTTQLDPLPKVSVSELGDCKLTADDLIALDGVLSE